MPPIPLPPNSIKELSRHCIVEAESSGGAADGIIHVITLGPHVEKILSDALGDLSQGFNFNLDPRLAQQLLEVTATHMEELASQGYLPLVLCSATVRLAFKRLTERALPNLAVLSYSEIAPGVEVRAEGLIKLHSDSQIGAA